MSRTMTSGGRGHRLLQRVVATVGNLDIMPQLLHQFCYSICEIATVVDD